MSWFTVPVCVDTIASCSVNVAHTPSNNNDGRVFPAEVKLPVPLNLKFIFVKAVVIPETRVMSPYISKLVDALLQKVPVNQVNTRFLQVIVVMPVVEIVTAPELASKIASSPEVGTDAPPAPPEVSDHFEPAVESQVADHPTQYFGDGAAVNDQPEPAVATA